MVLSTLIPCDVILHCAPLRNKSVDKGTALSLLHVGYKRR